MATKVIPSGNPIRKTAAETWICKGHCLSYDSIVWCDVTADSSDLILSRDSSSAEASIICRRKGKSGIDMSIFPQPGTFMDLYLQTMSSGKLEINKR